MVFMLSLAVVHSIENFVGSLAKAETQRYASDKSIEFYYNLLLISLIFKEVSAPLSSKSDSSSLLGHLEFF